VQTALKVSKRSGKVSKRKSGISLTKPSGEIRELTFGELAIIANDIAINPDLFLDVQYELIGEQFDRDYFQKVRVFIIEAMEDGQYQAPYEEAVDTISDGELEGLILALTVRLQAAAELCSRQWVEKILYEAMGNDHILPALGEYFCSTSLVYSKRLGGLIFDEKKAHLALDKLAAVPT
jgi:hypothetical protein